MNEATQKGEFLIVGSGPAGVSAALPLVQSGRRVVMIDGADDAIADVTKDSRAPWQYMLGEESAAILGTEKSPKLETPLARKIMAAFTHSNRIHGENFAVVGAVARGGLSRIWGAFAAAYDDEDMADWPVQSDEMRPFFDEVIKRIGVNGIANDDLADFYGRSNCLDPALSIGEASSLLLRRYQGKKRGEGFAMGLARNAIITRKREGRAACDLQQACLWGCSRGAIYDARFDVAKLLRYPNFTLIPSAVARYIRPHDEGGVVHLRDGRALQSPRIVLAAGCLASTNLAVSAMKKPPPHLALLSNPVMAMPLLIPARLGAPPSLRGYSLAQLGYRFRFGTMDGAYVTGALYETGGLPPSSFTARMPFSRYGGTKIFSALSPAVLVATCYFPGTFSRNVLTWSCVDEDIVMTVRGSHAPSLSALAQNLKCQLRAQFRAIGAWALPGATLAAPGTDVHYAGTLPMGGAGAGATNRWGELVAAPGIFVVDGAVLPSLPAKYPTLTIMANACRIGHYLAHS